MKIITGIKIRNFRSFVNKGNMVMNLKDLNLFSGANDSGKSNIFRTLNIFFNNEVSFGNPFDINKDFSRSLELKTQKVIDISIDFNQCGRSPYIRTGS